MQSSIVRKVQQSIVNVSSMPLGVVRSQVLSYVNVNHVLNSNFFVFSTQFGNSTRSYIRNFWSKKTARPMPGHMHKGKRLDGYNKNLYVSSFVKSKTHQIYKISYTNSPECHVIHVFPSDKGMGRS